MKRNEIQDLRNKTTQEIKGLLAEAKKELARLRLEQTAKKSKNTRQIFFQRKKIAQISTILKEKETQNV